MPHWFLMEYKTDCKQLNNSCSNDPVAVLTANGTYQPHAAECREQYKCNKCEQIFNYVAFSS